MKIETLKPGNTVDGTSFYMHAISATPNQLVKLFGQPTWEDNRGYDKVNMEWHLQLEDGTPFTLYDWKEYKILKPNQRVSWHIGGRSAEESLRVRDILLTL